MTLLYACLLGLIGLVLQGLVGRARAGSDIALGDGGHARILEAMRRHGNWAENVPFLLVLMALVEANGVNATWLHTLGAGLVVSRLVHPFGLDAGKLATPARMVGAGGTMLIALALIGTGLWQVLLR